MSPLWAIAIASALLIGVYGWILCLLVTRVDKRALSLLGLYIGGSLPDSAQPSITVDAHKSAQQIAGDITRRLFPRYASLLKTVLLNKASHEVFEAGRQRLAAEVAMVVSGRVNGEMVYSNGWELQVSGPASIRVNGNCNYLTLDQLKKIQAACPELFAGKKEGDFVG